MTGRGLLALGDSITRGRGGSPLLGVHPQSWALWLAEALDVPVRILAQDGHRAADLVREQLPRVDDGYDLAVLYIGVNDARAMDFDGPQFAQDVRTALDRLKRAADRLAVLTIPEDLGRPRAGRDVVTATVTARSLQSEARLDEEARRRLRRALQSALPEFLPKNGGAGRDRG